MQVKINGVTSENTVYQKNKRTLTLDIGAFSITEKLTVVLH